MKIRSLASWLAVCVALLPLSDLGANDESPIYRSHFEDNTQGLVDWTATMPKEHAEVSVEKSEGEHSALLVIRCEAQEEPLRLAQVAGSFQLEPLRRYELRVTLRSPLVRILPKGRARFFVTDARWLWSGEPLMVTKENGEWQTLVQAFEAPSEPQGHYRVRFEAVKAGLDLEVAKVEVVPVESR